MVKLSLIAKIYLYAAVAFFLSVPLAFMVGRSLVEMGRHESVRQYLTPQASFLKQEVERALVNGEPPSSRLAELSEAFRHRLRFVPWSQTGSYPSELASTDMLFEERRAEAGPRHWIRIDQAGAPVGALEMRPDFGPRPGRPGRPPSGRPPGGPMPIQHAGIWILLLLLIIVPPLWIWVIRPLRQMVAVARRLGNGELETPVVVHRQDEFGELEQAFENMRLGLRQLMAQKERLLTDVSHEIRGPVARMTLAVPLLKEAGASGPVMDIFERELHNIDALLGELLDLARGQGPHLTKSLLDLSPLARQVVEERQIALQHKNLQLRLDLQPAPVVGDERLLVRALSNLLDNAIKYTPPGGTIRVETHRDRTRSIFRVADNGAGIAPEHLPHVFEPFYRPDDSRSRETGGSGLGLAIVKTIVESAGGSVDLQSTPSQGTVIALRFPTKTHLTGKLVS